MYIKASLSETTLELVRTFFVHIFRHIFYRFLNLDGGAKPDADRNSALIFNCCDSFRVHDWRDLEGLANVAEDAISRSLELFLIIVGHWRSLDVI